MFCFLEVVVMPFFLADPVKEIFCIQEVVALSPVLADLVKEIFCFQEVVVVLSQVLADLVNGEFMQMQTKVRFNNWFAKNMKNTFFATAC